MAGVSCGPEGWHGEAADEAGYHDGIMLEILLTGTLVLLAVAIVVCVMLQRRGARLATEHARTHDELAQAKSHNADLLRRNEVLEKTHEHARDTLEAYQKHIDEKLKALTGEALKDSRQQFLQQAAEKLKPVSEALAQLQEAERRRRQDHGTLTEQLRSLAADQQTLRRETGNLVKALRRPEVRGRWGELQMKRLFDLAGLTERFDYDEQAKIDSADGKSLRPDFTIHLPNERVIVVDVKTPLDAYLNATEATEDDQRETLLAEHARQVRAAAENLASKAYWANCPGSPEFVVMFLPAESMLYAAIRHDAELIERAMGNSVIIATPTVVMALLKTVAMGWREQQVAENAGRISETGRELHERLSVMFGHLGNLHKAIGKTNDHFNKLVGSLESNVLPQARRFEQMGAASSRQIKQNLPRIEVTPRPLSAPEAVPASGDAIETES